MGYNVDEEYNRIVDDAEKIGVNYIVSKISDEGKKDPELISRLIRRFGYEEYFVADESIRDDKKICDALISVQDEIIIDIRNDCGMNQINLNVFPAAISKNKDIIVEILQHPLEDEIYKIDDELLENTEFLEFLLNNGIGSALKFFPEKSSDKEFAKQYLLKYPYAYTYFNNDIRCDYDIIKLVITHPVIICDPYSFQYMFEDISDKIDSTSFSSQYEMSCAVVLGLVKPRLDYKEELFIQTHMNKVLLAQISVLNKRIEHLENVIQQQYHNYQDNFDRK